MKKRGNQYVIDYKSRNDRFEEAIKKRKFDEAVKWANKNNVNKKIDGEWPVHQMASRGNHQQVMSLRQKGADLSVLNRKGEPLAYVAARQGKASAAQAYAGVNAGSQQHVLLGRKNLEIANQARKKAQQKRHREWAEQERKAKKSSSRQKKSSGLVRCPKCAGSGSVVYNQYTSFSRTEECNLCHGDGAVSGGAWWYYIVNNSVVVSIQQRFSVGK